jgi:hypothetical protein
MNILLHAIGYSSLALSIIGFVETAYSLKKAGGYNLLRVIIYCLLFGVGVALIV